MPQPATFPSAPRGISFSIMEHMNLRAWAEPRKLRLVTEIDHVVAGEEYEEVIALYDSDQSWRRLTLWRMAGSVMLQPASGPARRFPDINDALHAAEQMVQRVPPRLKRLRRD